MGEQYSSRCFPVQFLFSSSRLGGRGSGGSGSDLGVTLLRCRKYANKPRGTAIEAPLFVAKSRMSPGSGGSLPEEGENV